ncbi:MAG: hypothetical protein QM722_15085 [Piscinibacter sp.]
MPDDGSMSGSLAARRLAEDLRSLRRDEEQRANLGQHIVPAVRDLGPLLDALDAIVADEPDAGPVLRLLGLPEPPRPPGGAKQTIDHLAIARIALPLRLAGQPWNKVADAVAQAGILAPDKVLDRTQLVRSFEAAGAIVVTQMANELTARLGTEQEHKT